MSDEEKKSAAIRELQDLIDKLKRGDIVICGTGLEMIPTQGAYNGMYSEYKSSEQFVFTVAYMVRSKQ